MEKIVNRIECEPKCGFIVQSEDEKEALDLAILHGKNKHQMDVSIEEARGWLKSIKIEA